METKRLAIYKCPICDTVVEVLEPLGIELVCCGPAMTLLRERVAGAGRDLHCPVVEATDTGFRVQVGAAPHPMTPEHHLAWIELVADGKCYRQFCSPGQAPEAAFSVKAQRAIARAYCNVHGLWRSAEPGASGPTQESPEGASLVAK